MLCCGCYSFDDELPLGGIPGLIDVAAQQEIVEPKRRTWQWYAERRHQLVHSKYKLKVLQCADVKMACKVSQ